MRRFRRTLLTAASLAVAIACALAPFAASAQPARPPRGTSAPASSSPPPAASESPEEIAAPENEPTAETAPSEPFPTGRVVEVRFDPPVAGEDPWSVVRLHRGDVLDRLTVRAALRAALAGGTFAEARASVARIPGGLELLIDGERRFRVREVAFIGVQSRPVDATRAEFGIRAGEWVTGNDVDRAVETLRGAYNSNGWAETTITVRWRETDDPATRVLIVEVGEGHATLVRRVVTEGIPADEIDAVRGVLGLAAGDVANPQLARRAMDPLGAELRRAGFLTLSLTPIRFEPVGSHLVDVIVAARTGPRYRIQWQGIEPYPITALETAMRAEEERGLDPTTLNVFTARIRDFFIRRGYLDAQARIEIHPETPERAELRFVIDRGSQVLVRDVSFPGATRLSAAALRSVLNEVLENELPFGEFRTQAQPNEGDLAGGGAFLWVRPGPTYVPELYAEAARRMVNRYREAGFLDPTIPPPHIERVRLPDGRLVVDVAFAVTEGPRTFLDEVTFEGNDTVASRTLVDQIHLRLGVPLSSLARDEARTALAEYYRERGYMFVRVEPRVDASPDHTRARIRFEIHEGPQVRVGRILLRGNIRTAEWVVMQRLELRPGELYRPTRVRATQRRLGETGFFSGVTITPIDPDVEAPVKDIVVQVIEVLPQYLELRGGFSTGEGVRAGMEYGFRNITLGPLAMTAALSVQLGYQVVILPGDAVYAEGFSNLSIGDRLRRRISLSLILPAIRPLGPYFRGSLDLATARVIERQFAIDTASVATTLIYRPQRAFSLSATPEFQVNSLDALKGPTLNGQSVEQFITSASAADRERLIRLLLLPTGTTLLGALRITATIDLRDQVFNPHSGFYASATAEILGTARPFDPAPRSCMVPADCSSDQFCSAETHLCVSPPRQVPGNTARLTASLAGYIPLHFLDIVLATNLRAGINVHLDTEPCRVTYTNRLFFMGGSESMRGWLQDTMIPQDVIESFLFARGTGGSNRVDPCTGPYFSREQATAPGAEGLLVATQRGGDVFVNWRNELRIPIGSTGFALAAFIDVGNLWKSISNVNFALRASAGGGIRYITPIGPVAFDLGANLAQQSFEMPFAFHFSIGVF